MTKIAFYALVAIAGCQDIPAVGTGPPPCAWTVNHSGVAECHIPGPPPDPPVSFMAVDSTSHLEL